VLHARHHVLILAEVQRPVALCAITGQSIKWGKPVPSQSRASCSREPHASSCTHSHLHSPSAVCSVVAIHSSLSLSAGMRASDSRIALHPPRTFSACHLLTDAQSISIPAHGARCAPLSFLFSKPVNYESCFLVTPFFLFLFFIPKGLVLVVHTPQTNNPPYLIQ
jgi:hypothetical protein